jgi:hypothetical protein
MARVKQVARNSTGGRVPRTELAARAAKVCRGGPLETTRDYPHRVTVTAVRAHTKDQFVIIGPDGNNDQYFIPPSSLPPLVRGFLILLGPDIFVTAEDLQILTNSDCFYMKGVTPDMPGGVEVPFERIRLVYNPQTGNMGSARWSVMAAGHVELEWSPICALSYTARIGNSEIDFSSFADADPNQWQLYDSSVKAAATTLWEKYRWCKKNVEDQSSFPSGLSFSTTSLPHGLRDKSLTPVISDHVQYRVPFSRQDEPQLPCVPAALANITAGEDIAFATALLDAVSPGGASSTRFTNLREITDWLRHARQEFPEHGRIPYNLYPCLPKELRSLSKRDPVNRKDGIWLTNARRRLEWILNQTEGEFLVVIVASDFHATHVVGVSVCRRAIFDHEIRVSLPLSKEGFDSTCGGLTTCVGLGEVIRVVKNPCKKRSRPMAIETSQ